VWWGIACGGDPEVRTRNARDCLGGGDGCTRGAAGELAPRHSGYGHTNMKQSIGAAECLGELPLAGCRTARCGDACVQSVGPLAARVSVRPNTGLSVRAEAPRPTPPNSKAEGMQNLSRGSAGGGRAVHLTEVRTSEPDPIEMVVRSPEPASATQTFAGVNHGHMPFHCRASWAQKAGNRGVGQAADLSVTTVAVAIRVAISASTDGAASPSARRPTRRTVTASRVQLQRRRVDGSSRTRLFRKEMAGNSSASRVAQTTRGLTTPCG